jgi:hypothetical protein
MPNSFLVPETSVEKDGSGPALDLGSSAGAPVALTLGITKILEQESLDVSIWGSADGQDWGPKPLTAFPQKFYQGVYTILLDLSTQASVRHLQARWKLARWGVGSTKPAFSFYIFVEPFPLAGRAA